MGVELAAVIVPIEDVDLVSGLLWMWPIGGVEERAAPNGAAMLVIDADPDEIEALLDTNEMLRGLSRFRVEVDPDVWVESWKPWARAAELAPGLSVRPPWVESMGTPMEIVIDPERSWGHGAHPTTVMCVGALARCASRRRVLDVGCGSGTVLVAAALLGSERVVGIDIDPEATLAARANAVANGVEVVVSEDVLEDIDGCFDVVVANIGASVVEELAPQLEAKLAAGGVLLVSGVLEDQAEAVSGWFEGLTCDGIETRDGWALVVLSAPVDLPR